MNKPGGKSEMFTRLKKKSLPAQCGTGRLLLMQLSILAVLFCMSIPNAYALTWEEFFTPQGIVPRLTATTRSTTVTFPAVKVRTEGVLAVKAVSGQSFSTVIRHVSLGYADSATWELRTKAGVVLTSGTLTFNQDNTVSYTHNESEVVYLVVRVGRNYFYLKSSNVAAGIVASAPTKFISNLSRELYFSVPEKVKNFSIVLNSSTSQEHVKAEIYNPDGVVAVQGETSAANLTVTLTATVGTYSGATWKVKILQPSTGILEDYSIQLKAEVPPVFTLVSQDGFSYAPFGSTEKVSVLVDKVMAASTDYALAEWMVQAVKDAGFSTYAPRFYNSPGVGTVADWCAARDMKLLYWTRGTVNVSLTNPLYYGKRYWLTIGEVGGLSPNSDELWDYLWNELIPIAELSVTHPAIQGAFLDFESYFILGTTYRHAYFISYDDVITDQYEAARGVTLPVNPADRHAWLVANNRYDDFVAFQLENWRERCRQLRAAIDAINPQFQIYVYPFGNQSTTRPPFFYGNNAPVATLSTPQAPVVLADYQCYFDYTVIHDTDTLMPEVRADMDRTDILAEEIDTPCMLVSGFDPCMLKNPEFLARAPIANAERWAGHWVFYENFQYPSNEHTQVMNWLSWSNAKIAAQDYAAADEPYASSCSWDTLWNPTGAVPAASCQFSNVNNVFSTCNVRWTVPMAITCQSGVSTTLQLDLRKVGTSYTLPYVWELRSLSDIDTKVDQGTISLNATTGTISFAPQVTGTYFLVLALGNNAASIAQADARLAFYAAKPVDFFLNTTPLYINVPAGVTSFTLTAQAANSAEHVKISVYSPGGQLVTEDQTSPTDMTRVITVNVGAYGSGAWRIVPSRAGTYTLEDYYLTVGTEIPQFLSLSPSAMFTAN